MRQSREGVCSFEGCNNKIKAKGLCGKHYQQKRAEKLKVNLCACGCGEKTVYKYVWGHHTRLFTSEEQSRRGKMNDGSTMRQRYEGVSTHYRKVRGRHEHRIVAEEKLGRALEKGEIVHHIDGNKRNNNPDNLEIMTQSEHASLHMKERHNANKG
jgi:hypothetical protein